MVDDHRSSSTAPGSTRWHARRASPSPVAAASDPRRGSANGTCSAAATAPACCRSISSTSPSTRTSHFEAHTLAWGPPFYTKLAMSAAGGRAPEVATLHLSRLKGFSPSTMLDPIPVDLLNEAGIRESDFLPATWNRCIVDGKLYAVPLDQHPFVLYYNTEICKKAGLLGPDGKIKPVKGVDEFLDMLKAVKETTGKYGRLGRDHATRGGCGGRSTANSKESSSARTARSWSWTTPRRWKPWN